MYTGFTITINNLLGVSVYISSINANQYKSSNPQFTGLTKVFKNKIFIDGQKDIDEILKKHPTSRQVVGQLPAYIFNKLPMENRAAAIKEILFIFDKVTEIIRDFEPNSQASIDEIQNRRPVFANELLTEVFKKHKVINSYDDIDLQYINAGGKGKVFKLNGLRDYKNDDEYVIKVFHQIKSKDWQPFKSHGCYAEINNGIYWRNHEGFDTHRGKFFFGSFASGYIVSKFIDEDTCLPKRIVPEYKYGIKCTDEEKEGPLTGYNRTKGYNYDYGGMRVVNRLKNADKVARQYLEKMRTMPEHRRGLFWEQEFKRLYNKNLAGKPEINRDGRDVSEAAGLALGIKYLQNKTYYIDKCLTLNLPKVNQALAYVLKYLTHKEGLEYFEKLVQTDDEITQVILFNEIPLLAKRKSKTVEIKDDINASLEEIIPDRIYKYYKISEKYALPSTIEHLASFIHLLPNDNIPAQHLKLANEDNDALYDRMIWKFHFLPREYYDILALNLSYKIKNPVLQQKLLNMTLLCTSADVYEQIKYNIENLPKRKI